LHLMR